jgi:hypothetical protein
MGVTHYEFELNALKFNSYAKILLPLVGPVAS